MRMTRFFLLLLVLIVPVFISGCGNKVQDDLLNYINNEMGPAGKLSAETMDKYNSMIGENAGPDIVLLATLKKEIVPKYSKYIEMLEATKPETEEVNELHAILLDGANDQMAGLKLMVQALEEGSDLKIVAKANEKMESGKNKLAKWDSKLEELCKANKVEFQKSGL